MSDGIVALAGGVGGSKLLVGLSRSLPPDRLTIITNTGDDFEHLGLYVCPDTDTVIYTLAGLADPVQGWGIAGDTRGGLELLGRLGAPTWFQLGDQDLALQVWRSALLRAGRRLTEITDAQRRAFGLASRILPMTDERVPTRVESDRGRLGLQEYLVLHRTEPTVRAVIYEGAARAPATAEVLQALREAAAIVLCPSNPFISLGPILALAGVRELIQARRRAGARVIAVSPIVGGRALKGPAARMLESLGHQVSALGVARIYRDLVNVFVIDQEDAGGREAIAALGMEVEVAPTVLRTLDDKLALGRRIVDLARA
jgi:LPPG:FO 2-phospho-L-lactate transferase